MKNVEPTSKIAEPVDLGLSAKWASFNTGASKPEEYGGLYGWADVTGKIVSTSNEDYPTANPPREISGTEYDIARAKWGDGWRLPTQMEQHELIDKAVWKKTSLNSVAGDSVTGRKGNSIFLPAVSDHVGNNLY